MRIKRTTLVSALLVVLVMAALPLVIVIAQDGCETLAHVDTSFGRICAEPYLGGNPK